jgi:hypothetical protein
MEKMKEEQKFRVTLSGVAQWIAILVFILVFTNYYVVGGIPGATWIEGRYQEMTPIVSMLGIFLMLQFYITEVRNRETTHGLITGSAAVGSFVILFIYLIIKGGTGNPLYTDIYEIFYTNVNATLVAAFAISGLYAIFVGLRIRSLTSLLFFITIVITLIGSTDLAALLGILWMEDVLAYLLKNIAGPLAWSTHGGGVTAIIPNMMMILWLAGLILLKERLE